MTCCQGDVQVLDYTNAEIVALEAGTVRIQTGTFRIIHVIDLEQYNTILNEAKQIMTKEIDKDDESYQYLTYEMQTIERLLSKLKPTRNKRAINEIGTVWKWIAGTPDHEDFQILSDKVRNVLENNNKQVVINKLLKEKINEVIKKTNIITNSVLNNSFIKEIVTKRIERKLKIIKDDLINIDHAIQWTKVGVINPLVLSETEMRISKKFFDEQKMSYINLVEALEFGEVKMASNGFSLIYIISLPKTSKQDCKKMIVRSVRKEKLIVKISNNNIIICKNDILEIINECKVINDVTICKERNFKNITTDTCLPKLLNSQPSVCTRTNAQHVPLTEELLPGILLLNSYNNTVEIDQNSVTLEGTFLIKFHNSTIKLNQRTYENSQVFTANPLPAIVQPGNMTTTFEEVLSLNMLKELHFTNAAQLKQLDIKYNTSLSSLSVISIILLIVIGYKIRKQIKSCNGTARTYNTETTTQVPMATPQHSEDTVLSEGGRVNVENIFSLTSA